MSNVIYLQTNKKQPSLLKNKKVDASMAFTASEEVKRGSALTQDEKAMKIRLIAQAGTECLTILDGAMGAVDAIMVARHLFCFLLGKHIDVSPDEVERILDDSSFFELLGVCVNEKNN